MLYGGSKEAAASVSKDAEVMLKLGSTPDKREQYRLMRDAMEKRFIRVTHGSVVGGASLGMFTAAFCGLQNLLAEKRVSMMFSMLLELVLPLCCYVCINELAPFEANEGNMTAESGQGGETMSGVGATIDRLEEHLSKS